MRLHLTASLLLLFLPALGTASDPAALTAEEIVRRVNERPDGDTLDQRLTLDIRDARGRGRVNVLRGMRRDFGKERRTRLMFEQPRLLGGTGFLSFDYPDDRADDQWIYLRTERRVRRIAASGRGDSFFGSEFTFEDLKNGTRINAHEFEWSRAADEELEGRRVVVLDYRPRSRTLADDLGYGRARMYVDPKIWLPVRLDFWDRQDNPSKRILLSEVREVGGIWTAHRYDVSNLKTQRSSSIVIDRVQYGAELAPHLFNREQLGRALR